MLGITEKYNQFKKSTYFAGGKFVIYAACVCLVATFAVGYLGLIIGFPLLTFPLAMLIFHPVIWIIMGIVVTAAYKLAKNYINGKGASKGEKSEEKDTELQDLQGKTPENQEKPKTPDRDSGIGDDISIGSTENKQSKQTKIVQYNTTGDGNCFFHAVFGDNSSGPYKAERAQDMRMEWHKFLSQFEHLDDYKMNHHLVDSMHTVFSMFLDGTEERIEQVKRIIESAKQKNAEVETAYNNAKKEKAEPSVENLFLNMPELYQAYLETIKSQSYHVFIEEIPILASLANIEIDVYYKSNGNDVNTLFLPNAGMINEGYQQNNELWGNKEQETVYLAHDHYERAEIVEVEPSLMKKANSALQGAAAACVNALGLNT